MVHCERCGAESVPEAGRFDHCVPCGLYVCSACWDARGFCVACVRTLGRRTVSGDARLLRRVDRRLRETVREAAQLAQDRRAAPRPRVAVTEADIACLGLKVEAADRVGASVIGGPMSPRRREALRPLADRIGRHLAVARASVVGLGEAESPPDVRTPTAWIVDRFRASVRAIPRAYWVPVFAGLLFAVLVLASWDDAGPTTEGVLGDRVSGTPAPVAESPSVQPPGLPSAPPVSEELAFDDDRIGPLVDPRWGQPTDLVRVVAYPTSFDRSVEVATADGEPVEACFSPGPVALAVRSLSVDVFVPAIPGATATVALRGATPGSELLIEIGTSAVAVSAAGRTVASETGVESERWYRIRVDAGSDGGTVAVGLVRDGGQQASVSGDVPSLPPVARLCFGAGGAANSSIYYDNFALDYHASAEG